MTSEQSETGQWSLAGQAIALILVAEIVVTLLAIAYPEFRHPRMMLSAAVVMIVSAVVAARAHMPIQPKALLIAAVCTALLSLAAAQDPFGLRAVDRSIDAATRATAEAAAAQAQVAPGPAPVSLAPAHLALRGRGDPGAATFADDLAGNVAGRIGDYGGPYRIDGMIDVTAGTGGATYRLTWTLGEPGETRWCGRIVASGQMRAAVLDSFGLTLATALLRSRDGGLTCG